MLGALAYLGKFEKIYVISEQVVDSKGEAALESGRRRQTGAERNISCKHCIEALNLASTLDGFAADAEDIAAPLLLRLVLLVEAEAAGSFIINGI